VVEVQDSPFVNVRQDYSDCGKIAIEEAHSLVQWGKAMHALHGVVCPASRWMAFGTLSLLAVGTWIELGRLRGAVRGRAGGL
jgi:hypothetical protein